MSQTTIDDASPHQFEASLAASKTIDWHDAEVASYSQKITAAIEGDIDRAVALYYAVRDDIRYDPYSFDVNPASFAASVTLKAGIGWCVPKAILLAACCRSIGIPARLGFADVKNHLSTARMRETMKTDVFHWHGYTSLFLNGRWVKATPAFNIELCEKFGLKPLEFDGLQDSIYHEFDQAGNRHMEYLLERGEFDEVPFEDMMRVFGEVYGDMVASAELSDHSFDEDVDLEVSPNHS
ncbi:MAG: transglutaminase-like domain-containing protein [Cellvibrionaceae bacterium]